LVFFFVILPWGNAVAQNIQVLASVDKTTATLENAVELSLTVLGLQNAPPPTLPPLPAFRIQSTGTSTSVQVINGQSTSSITFSYRLVAQKAGAFTIPAIEWTLNGKTYATQPITLNITVAATARTEDNAEAFIESTLSNPKPFVNEQVIYTFKFLRRTEAANANLNQEFGGLRREDLGKPKEYAQVINGVQYHVYEAATAVFPNKPGPVEIPPAVLEVDLVQRGQQRLPHLPIPGDPFRGLFNDPFFSGTRQLTHKIMRTKPLRMETQALPERDRPKDFSNLVGQFSLSADISKKSVEFGESVTLTVTISGVGNVKDISVPELNAGDAFKVYPDHPDFKQWITENKIAGGKTVKYALIPQMEGAVEIPRVALSYFDPQQKKYITLKTPSLQLQVRAGKAKEHLDAVSSTATPDNAGAAKIQIVGKDIFPIHTRLEDFKDSGVMANKSLTWRLGALLSPVAVFITLAYFTHRSRRMKSGSALSRNREAHRLAQKRLAEIRDVQDVRESAKEISRTLREYIGDKLNIPGSALTAAEVEEKLKALNLPEADIGSACALLKKCESLQYAVVNSDTHPATTLADELAANLKRLEKHL
jgi:hypothetical protein